MPRKLRLHRWVYFFFDEDDDLDRETRVGLNRLKRAGLPVWQEEIHAFAEHAKKLKAKKGQFVVLEKDDRIGSALRDPAVVFRTKKVAEIEKRIEWIMYPNGKP